MKISLSWILGLSCLGGKEGIDWVYYEVFDKLLRESSEPNPYRNPDNTFSDLVFYEMKRRRRKQEEEGEDE